MITAHRTWSPVWVKYILTHTAIWPFMSDDFAPRPDEFYPTFDAGLWYLLLKHEHDTLGLALLVQKNTICWDIHFAMLPEHRGETSLKAVRAAIRFAWEGTSCRRLVAQIETSNRLALRLAEKAGFELFGVNERSVMKRGKLRDLALLGLSKPEGFLH